MNRLPLVLAAVLAAVVIAGAVFATFWLLEQPVPEATSDQPLDVELPAAGAAAPELPLDTPEFTGGKIQVRLYVLGSSGKTLEPESYEVQLEASLQKQCRQVIELLLHRSAAIPPDVQLREVFITSQGVAYVDFSQELVQNHPGGSSAEELTVFGLSNTLIANFPAIKMVKILVEGREVQTLAGHLDLTVPYGRAPEYLNPPSESPGSAGTPNDTN